jgi:hypothetical protein
MPPAVYNENIYKNERKTVAEVIYSLTAPDSKEGGELVLPPGNEFSRPEQVMNEIHAMNAPIATLEPDYWRLDGTFVLPVHPEQSRMEVGWWSAAMSDESGILPEPLVIERVFDQVQTFNAVGITFDTATGNCCSDFEVSLYDAYGGLIYHEHITDNTEAYRRTERAGHDILRVVIKLNKTSKPFRYARVIEVDFGIVLEYRSGDNSNLKSLNMIRETDPTGRSFPLPEMRLKIINRGDYDQLDSGTYAPYFQTRQRMEYRHGLVLPDESIEWIRCGVFYLKDWKVSDKIVEFITAGQSALLENSMFFDSSFQTFTIGQLVAKMVPQGRVNLDSPRISGYFGNTDRRRLVTMLSELSCCLVYEDVVRNNDIIFDDILALDGAVPIDKLDYNNTFRSPSVTLGEYYNAINLAEYTISTEYRQVSKTEQHPGEVTIYFDAPVTGDVDIELPPGFQFVDRVVHAMSLTGTLIGAGPVEIIIHGSRVTLNKSEVLYKAPWHTGREPDNPYKVDLPCMIRAEGFEEFRNWFLDRRFRMINKRLSADIFWAQNPDRELCDKINAQITRDGSCADMIITSQELSFEGALKGRSKVLGNVVMR